MNKKCDTVIISDKAYNAIIRESFAKHPVETGGILLGYILDNGMWVVMEMIPPGINCIFQVAYFEYDQAFVNYLGTSVANQYKEPLQVLGLWHRHPGSMDYFSSTDDGTNSEFASRNPYGVISGLVNIDPAFRLTMYHLDHNDGTRPRNIAYTNVEVEVGDDLIPENFFELRYVDSERSELHPIPSQHNVQSPKTHDIPKSPRNKSVDETEEACCPQDAEQSSSQKTLTTQTKHAFSRLSWRVCGICFVIFLLGIFAGTKISPLLDTPNPTSKQKQTQNTTGTNKGSSGRKDSGQVNNTKKIKDAINGNNSN